MASPPKPTPRRRLRGRLGIDVAAQSPGLPPIDPKASSTRPTPLNQQQQDELRRLKDTFTARLQASQRMLDLAPLVHAVARAAESVHDADTDHADCFSAAKALASRVEAVGHAPFLSQFLLHLVSHIEQLVHDKRQQEATAAQKLVAPPTANQHDELVSNSDTNSDTNNEPSSSSDTDANQPAPTEDLRHVPTRAKFRTALRSRQFPPSRVPAAEFVTASASYMPFEHLATPLDVASLRLRGHDAFGSAQWALVLFPKPKPALGNASDLAAFFQWAATKQPPPLAPTTDFAMAQQQFADALAVQESVCFELSRLVFDACPTSARFLVGLFSELAGVAARALANASRQQQIVEQRHRNVQLELARLGERRRQVEASLAALQATLQRRQLMVLRARELIIRRRKRLSLLLCADQVLLRRVAAIVHHAQDIADDALTSEAVAAASGRALVLASPYRVDDKLAAVDQLVAWIVAKYSTLLPRVAQWRPPTVDRPPTALDADTNSQIDADANSTIDANSKIDANKVIVLDTSDVRTAVDEYKATLLRLQRLLSAKSPDSATGWDPQELWDQALFLPPHEEVQDLEREVQSLCLEVEDAVLEQRRRRGEKGRIVHAAVQTEIRSCMAPQQRWRARPVAPPTLPSSSSPTVLHPPRWHWRSLRRRRTPPPPPTAPLPSAEEDHRTLLASVVPAGLRSLLRAVPSDYVPHQLLLPQVHSVISYLLNGVWRLVQDDFQRPSTSGFFSPSSSSSSSLPEGTARFIPLASVHEYIYRLYLQHFPVESVASARLLDLLLSSSKLDTQSAKVLLFARLLHLPGVPPLPPDGFWFALKAMHVLQRSCSPSSPYFLLDASGENEFVPFASGAEAIAQLFGGAPSDVLKRLRLKLGGLASVFGTVWIPAYHVLSLIMDEWHVAQEGSRAAVERTLFLDHASERDPFTGLRFFNVDPSSPIPSFRSFLHGFQILQLKVDRGEAVAAYRQLVHDARGAGEGTLDRHVFYTRWMEMVMHAVNVAQQQMLRSPSASPTAPSAGGAGVQMGGGVSDALASATQQLALKFLRISWEQMKAEIIRRLDAKFNDVGLQVRLVQQMEAALSSSRGELPSSSSSSSSAASAFSPGQQGGAWRSFQQLLHIAYSPASASL